MLPFFILFFGIFISSKSEAIVATVYDEDGKFVIKEGIYDLEGVAVGKYVDDRKIDGYEKLEISSNGTHRDEDQMYASGLLEGYLTQKSILELWENYLWWMNLEWGWESWEDIPKNITDFMSENLKYTYSQAEKFQKNDPFYRQIFLLLKQLEGLVDGASSLSLKLEHYFLLNSKPDLHTVRDKFFPDPSTLRPVNKLGCSVLIKPTEEDLFFSHTSYLGYTLINKFYKSYMIPLRDVEAKKIVFTTSPGLLTSGEDYYLLDSGLAVTETSNGIYNTSLFNFVVPNHLFYWFRITAANRLSSSSEEWMKYMSTDYSGTYSNQWMVLNYNLWNGWDEVSENSGLLLIGSEIPSLFEIKDVSSYLVKPTTTTTTTKKDWNINQGFWTSYNIPFLRTVYEKAGYEEMFEKYGDKYSHKNCPRGKIFQRDAKKVESMDSMKKILLYNDYKNDPLSLGDPGNAIAARFDLRTGGGKLHRSAFGSVDGKITSSKLIKDGCRTWIYAGPTHQNDDTPPFSWSEFPDVQHKGQPEVYDFQWVLM